MYPFPGWRRIIFVAVLIVVIVIALAPSITEGTIKVQIFGVSPSGGISHLYIKFTSLEIHTHGFGFGTGWVSINETTPQVDLIHSSDFLPNVIVSAQITSGRYDSIRLRMSNSTAFVAGTKISFPRGSALTANFTLPISPNGFGNVLLVVSFDDSLVFASPASLSLQVVQTSVA